MTKAQRTIAASAIIGVAALAAVTLTVRTKRGTFPPNRVRVEIPQESVTKPTEYIAQHADAKDKTVQTHVTRAKMTLAFQAAKDRDYREASQMFLAASKEHKGSEAMSPEYGTLSDQALYQAIVCTEARGEKESAIAQYRKFMEERKESPLVHMCHRRLERLFGASQEEDDRRLQQALDAQQQKIQFETSVCGPKAIEYLLPLLGKPVTDYKTLADYAGTTSAGTTLDGMRKALGRVGLTAFGLEMNAQDLRKLTKPAIWLRSNHYVAITRIEGGKMVAYDPRFKLEEAVPLPDPSDKQFRATVLAFELPEIDLTTEAKAQ